MATDPAPVAASASGWSSPGRRAALGVGAAALYAAWRASVDLDPVSLWHDDVWLVALATADDSRAWFASPASAPLVFKAIVRSTIALGSDLELAAQAAMLASKKSATGPRRSSLLRTID